MRKNQLVIATRESPLALWQAEWVKERLQAQHPALNIRLLGMTTTADTLLSVPLLTIGGKGLFVKELEEALLSGAADIAVHSMKDVPMTFPPNLHVPVICERADPGDVFVSNDYLSWADLPAGALVGTSSLRRQNQLRALRPDVQWQPIRGNIGTRLQKLDDGQCAGLILAAAGLKRLGWENRIGTYFTTEEILPAAGQGALGIECRLNDTETLDYIALLDHRASHICITAERAMCTQLNGGCQLPVAAFAEIKNNQLSVRGLVASVDGTVILRSHQYGALDAAEEIGIAVADDLLARGAEAIMRGTI